jgi:NAD(P)-dependent dehydrogenase (short-subunit alcohol dehydrogenase family)
VSFGHIWDRRTKGVPILSSADDYRREMVEDTRNQQALRRRGLPEEQAAAIAFLASDDASFGGQS